MKKEIIGKYKNLIGEIFEVVCIKGGNSRWELRLKENLTKKKYVHEPDGMVGGNYLDLNIHDEQEELFGNFSIEATGDGNGTILMKAMLVKIKQFEENNNVKIDFVKGWLSTADKANGNWENSISFYMNFVNTLNNNDVGKGKVNVSIHLIDKDEKYKIGKKISQEEFKIGNNDGYIVYSLKL